MSKAQSSENKDIVPTSTKDIANVDKQIQEINAAVGKKTQDNVSIIRMLNGKFILPGGEEGDELRVIILNFVTRHIWYPKKYQDGVTTAPACWATSEDATHLAPGPDVETPISKDCDSCPKFEWGSAGLPDSQKKACTTKKLLAVVPEDSGDDAPIRMLAVPPNSLPEWNQYTGFIKHKFGGDPIMVSTRITLDQKLTFNSLYFTDPHPNDRIRDHVVRRDEALAVLLVSPIRN